MPCARIALLACTLVAFGCGDGDDGDSDSTMLAAWTDAWITAYDREVRAMCPCLASQGAFPTADECITAIGSGPIWRDCALAAVEAADAGQRLDAEQARCLIESKETRADCLEAAACEPAAFSACLAQPNLPADCPPLDADLTVLLIEQCPDLGLLSR